jgi:hypothetical protein
MKSKDQGSPVPVPPTTIAIGVARTDEVGAAIEGEAEVTDPLPPVRKALYLGDAEADRLLSEIRDGLKNRGRTDPTLETIMKDLQRGLSAARISAKQRQAGRGPRSSRRGGGR